MNAADEGHRKRQAEIEAENKRLSKEYPAPPSGFDPLKATPEELKHYGLPTRPKKDAVADGLWRSLVSAPRGHASHKRTGGGTFPAYELSSSEITGGGREQTSHNWSGIAIAADPQAPIDQVWATWQLPDVKPDPSAPSSAKCFVMSSWIGIDGYLPTSSSLPQIGVTQSVEWKNGRWQILAQAWWQWWQRGKRNPVKPIASVPVAAGHMVVCNLERVNEFHVVGQIVNLTTNVSSGPIRMPAPYRPIKGPIPGPIPVPILLQLGAPGATAEWIAERPMKPNAPTTINGDIFKYLYPLPVFKEVQFQGCVALSLSAGRSHDLLPSKVLRMAAPVLSPSKGVIVSRTHQDPRNDPHHQFVVGPGVLP
jgi:hypothetical protein